MATSISQSIAQLHDALSDYIEATYHISNPELVKQRKELLNAPGVISQKPFIESTPRYVSGRLFESIEELPKAALDLFKVLSQPYGDRPGLIYDPPYKHQLDAVEKVLVHRKNVMIMTGTGSGKTESFLLPILGKLIGEAARDKQAFQAHALRAMILYPMNALVNDQLGRIRNLFGDERLKALFMRYSDRIPTFARYTSRTPYPGIRDKDKDRDRLSSIRDFYVAMEEAANGPVGDVHNAAVQLMTDLKAKGKWPSKPSIANWFGGRNARWMNSINEFQRAITLAEDSELITRHEVQATPPDLLITNYSMLEYMLLRPIERSIFEATLQWLQNNPDEKFLIVIDEAHLYRGAAGAEVGLLLRRLRERLEIPPERFQVICASASFNDQQYAVNFASQLAGVPQDSFECIKGEFALRTVGDADFVQEAQLLSEIDLDGFYEAIGEARLPYISSFLKSRGISFERDVPFTLFKALEHYPPLNKLINDTMGAAKPVDELATGIFHAAGPIAAGALHALTALGSIARRSESEPGLLPCRLHSFFRGLPGLWACIDPNCNALGHPQEDGVCGKLYAQPRNYCECGARVFEFYTCRSCGTAHIRAYTDDPASPSNLWQEQGMPVHLHSSVVRSLFPIDILLELQRNAEGTEIADLDIRTAKLNASNMGLYTRQVLIRRIAEEEGDVDRRFVKCPVCEYSVEGGFPVQDHQTKGDEPFRALIARQLQIQPPNDSNKTYFAPLRGRKVLIFSDSRQTAAKLAPNLQMFSHRDAIRPLLIWGARKIKSNTQIGRLFNLNDCYFAILIAANYFDVRLRPELAGAENFQTINSYIRRAVKRGALDSEAEFTNLFFRYRSESAPESLLKEIVNILTHYLTGVEALALASVCIIPEFGETITDLPDIPGVAESAAEKISLANLWVRCWSRTGYWLNDMPDNWWQPVGIRPEGRVGGHRSGVFQLVDRFLNTREAKALFRSSWLPALLTLADNFNGTYRMMGRNLSLDFSDDWVRCQNCSSVYRPTLQRHNCTKCNNENVHVLDPENDEVFKARKGYYRNATVGILSDPAVVPVCLSAAEHTAQLNAPQSEDIFSKGEENELLFQDIDIQWPVGQNNHGAIDILSSTTTMEVGIDIGALSGVALRNMPPGRANYQQRAGRAGRRGNAIATVIAFGSVDSHDEHFFSNPKELISGDVVDPIITLDNVDIVKRHVRAFLLQNYHRERLPVFLETHHTADLFSVLGSVSGFLNHSAPLNRWDLLQWLNRNAEHLTSRIAAWIPDQLNADSREMVISDAIADCIREVDDAIDFDEDRTEADESLPAVIQEGHEDGDESNLNLSGASEGLLDRLLYRGKLPRYAFPTDVANFYIFDVDRSTNYKTMMRFAPSQGLPIALTQYAPDKQVWIANKCYTSGAIYSPIYGELYNAWQRKRLYYECQVCGFAKSETYDATRKTERHLCDACGETLRPPQTWLRPPGFAHPIYIPEQTSPDGMPEVGYATRAKLYLPFGRELDWRAANNRITGLKVREHLLVSNAGPHNEGYNYCVKCGCIESRANSLRSLNGTHPKPFPNEDPTCDGGRSSNIVLGTDFITDVALFSLNLAPTIRLLPGTYTYNVALRTLCEALAKAACQMLELEPNDIVAEYRPALTEGNIGRTGEGVEIFLYDTLPGGAGFSSQLIDRGLELFQRALAIMTNCSESCDSSCYRCLRMFRNKIEHHLIDRHVGISLCHFLLYGEVPGLDKTRIRNAMLSLQEDLLRNVDRLDIVFERTEDGSTNYSVMNLTDGSREYKVGIASPLTPEVFNDDGLRRSIAEGSIPRSNVYVVDEFLVRTNLPSATILVMERLSLHN